MFAIVSIVVLICLTTSVKCDDIGVTLKMGPIVGYKENIYNEEGNVFLGIPYAVPPLRDLRFKKPQPLTEKRTNPLIAKNWPKICMQSTNLLLSSTYYNEVSEDCLYLNVWSPTDLKEDFSQNLKAVMVFIHGGGYHYMGTSYKHHNASVLSSMGDVVVVTMNYRLGAFGFLFGDSDEAPGNVGLYDQALALEWVQENIARFGGDPNKVTLFGESAGGFSTSLHFLSPISQELFHRVIIMSGTIDSQFGIEPKEVAIRKTLKFAQLLGCAEDEENEVSSRTLNCLRQVDAQKMIEVQHSPELLVTHSLNQIPFYPIFEEEFVPKDPAQMLYDASFMKGVDVMIGTVANEGFVIHSAWSTMSAMESFDWQQMLELFVQQHFLKASFSDTKDILKYYFGQIRDKRSEAAKLSYYLALGDIHYNCFTANFARQVSKVNNVYQYLFNYSMEDVTDALLPECDTPDNTCHANDLPITFGTASGLKDREVSERWIKILTDFAKSGFVPWPKFKVNAPYYKFTADQSTDELLNNYRGDACKLWNPLLLIN